jgi:hypothetical protein
MPHIPDHHADHDRLLVAAYAAGDATGADLDQAISLVAACPECAELHRDLRAIASALPDLPPPARSRDFRLTPGQAAALRPAGWRRWLAPLAGPRFSFAAPMGTGLATLGIAGLLLAGALGAPAAADLAAGGTAAQAMPESSAIEAPAEIPAASPDVAGGEAPGSPGMQDGTANGFDAAGTGSRAASESADDTDIAGEPGATAAPEGVLTAPEANPVEPSGTAGPEAQVMVPAASPAATAERQALTGEGGSGPLVAMLPLLSGLLLVAGAGLLLLRVAGSRLGA